MMQSSIIGNVVGKAVDGVVKAYGYVCQYRLNMENLRTEIINLEDRREIIRRKVQEASERGELVENAVSHWQTKVDRQLGDAEQLMQQSTDNENMDSLACTRQRYGLSKQAEEMIADVKQLIHDGHFNEISHPKQPPAELEFQSNVDYVNFDSRKPIFNAIVNALNDPNVNMIGIYGLGGVGKTTLAKEVGQQKRQDRTFNQFQLVAVSSNLSVKEIQLKLADCLNLQFNAPGEQGRAKQLWNRLLKNREKHLVILDDIWEAVDMKAIGIPIVDGNTGCKVLLTSRNEDLLRNEMKVHRNFTIVELPNPEAFTLFKEKVGNSIVSQPELHSLAEKVSDKCKGLPVAINALGAALKGKPVHAWRNALDKLERYRLTNIEGIHPSVCASLRVSYDMLQSSDAKSCFLLCCLYAEDGEISVDDLMRHCVARGLFCQDPRTFDEATNAIYTVVDTLKSSSLLLNASHEKVVKIHDVIRDVGIKIGREEEAFFVDCGARRWPRDSIRYSAISLRSGKIKRLPSEVTCPQLHTLILDNDKLSNLEVPDKFFSGMGKLTVLILNQVCIWRLPSSLAKLTELRMLYLSECKLEDIAILGDLKINLEVVGLRGSSIKALPIEIGQLIGLRLLDLQDCLNLKVIPQGVISHLTSLEELYFPDSFDDWEFANNGVNVSLEEVSSLLSTSKLTALHIHIPNVMLLPNEGLMFESLKRFNITMGQNCKKCREGIEMHYSLDEAMYENMDIYSAKLKLYGITFQNNFIPLANKAEFLTLIRIEDLEKAFHSCSFNKLTTLIISRCKMKYLFSKSIASGLIHLEFLEVSNCEIMEEIVRFEGQNEEDEAVKFDKLKVLSLYCIPNLIRFYAKKEKTETSMETSSTSAQPLFNEKVIFPVLKKLLVIGLHNIVEIWDNQSPLVHEDAESFSELEILEVLNCAKLMNLAPSSMLGWLNNLQDLSVQDCPNIESIIFENGKEEEEEATDDSTLVIIPRLSTLFISNTKKLSSFYSSSKGNNARCLFNHQVIFPVLKTLDVRDLDNIVDIWAKQSPLVHKNAESFSQLEEVNVQTFPKLMHLIPSYMLGRLQNLQDLCVSGCPNIESIVFDNGKDEEEEVGDDSTLAIVPQLSYLLISDMENLRSFYSSSKRSNAQSLFNHQVAFPALRRLDTSGLPNITEIWDKQPLSKLEQETKSFYKLAIVNVDNCEQLAYVFPSYMLPQLQNKLENLYITKCKEMEVICSGEVKEKEAANNDIIVFPKLKDVTLWRGLDKLKSFYSGMQIFFSDKDAFPALELIDLDENLEIFLDGTSTKIVAIEECGTSRKRKQPYGEEGSMTLSLTDLASPSYNKAREELSLPPPSPLHHQSVKMSDSFSESCTNGSNSGGGGEIMLFGVKVKVDPMRKSMSMNNPSQYDQPEELANVFADISLNKAVHHQLYGNREHKRDRSPPPPSPFHHRSVKTSGSFSESCTNGGDGGNGGEIMLFGVRVSNPSQYEQPQELANDVAVIAAGCASVDEAVHLQSYGNHEHKRGQKIPASRLIDLDENLEIFWDWDGTSTKIVAIEECDTSRKRKQPYGEEGSMTLSLSDLASPSYKKVCSGSYGRFKETS